jgi:hypothetical protein
VIDQGVDVLHENRSRCQDHLARPDKEKCELGRDKHTRRATVNTPRAFRRTGGIEANAMLDAVRQPEYGSVLAVAASPCEGRRILGIKGWSILGLA